MEITLDISADSTTPLYQRLVDAFIKAIDSGRLLPGAHLPSIRELTRQLGISRDTVLRCYAELQNLSYVQSAAGKGNFVLPRSSLRNHQNNLSQTKILTPVEPSRLSVYACHFLGDRSSMHPTSADFEFLNFGGVPPEFLPTKRWHELLKEQLVQTVTYDTNVLGRMELRTALANYLNRFKDLNCTPSEVTVHTISISAQTLLCRMFLNDGDTVAVEDPGYGGIRNIAYFQSLNLFPVPIDEEGMIVDKLDECPHPIKLIYVTPSRHDPTGTVMSAARRSQLLEWANRHNAWIIEDDHDGDYRYDKVFIPKLKTMDKDNRVIFVSSFWKSLYPLTSLSYCVMPENLTGIMEQIKIQTESLSEVILQSVLTEMLNGGFLERHMSRIWRKFASRRQNCIFELQQTFRTDVTIQEPTGGTSLVMQLRGFSKEKVLDSAKAAKIPLISTSQYYFGSGRPNEYLLDFVIYSEERMKKVISFFRDELEK